MHNTALLKLLLTSSNSCPYNGLIRGRLNIISAHELALLFRDFALRGHEDEAMHIDVDKWDGIIYDLKLMMR